MRTLIALTLALQGTSVMSDTVFAKTTIRARDVIAAESVHVKDVDTAGAVQTIEFVVGAEARHAIYAGQPILKTSITQAASVERNQIATATFVLNGLTIATEVRALERGSIGDVIRAMNLSSRNTIRVQVLEGGYLKVLP